MIFYNIIGKSLQKSTLVWSFQQIIFQWRIRTVGKFKPDYCLSRSPALRNNYKFLKIYQAMPKCFYLYNFLLHIMHTFCRLWIEYQNFMKRFAEFLNGSCFIGKSIARQVNLFISLFENKDIVENGIPSSHWQLWLPRLKSSLISHWFNYEFSLAIFFFRD